jgi:hypothetical protein
LNQLCRINTANKVSAAGRVEQIRKSQPKICWTFGCNESEHRMIGSLSNTRNVDDTGHGIHTTEGGADLRNAFRSGVIRRLSKHWIRSARFRIQRFSRPLLTQEYSLKSPSVHPDPFSEFVHGRRPIIRKRQHDRQSLILLPLPSITDPVSIVILEDARSSSPSLEEDYIR